MCKPSSASAVAANRLAANGSSIKKNDAPGMVRLALCAVGICSCFLYYGMLQERLFTGQDRLGPTFALVTACITNVAVACLWQRISSQDVNIEVDTRPVHHGLFFLTALSYVLAMACSNEAIPYVSYPVAVLAKSCKLIPLMIVGQLLEGRLYSTLEWLAALLISAGICTFHFSRMTQQSSSSLSLDNDNATYGMMLLLFSLACDGALSSCQNFLKQQRPQVRPPNAVETMLYINLYALVLLVPLAVFSGQWKTGIRLLQTVPSLPLNVLILNLAIGIGQVFIFLTITWYSPLVTTTITTTRKFFTILLSVYKFGHVFTTTQWTAIGLVFTGLYLSIMVQQRQRKEKSA